MTQAAALRCTQRTQRKIEIDPILAFTTQHDASATEGVHKLKRNATQRLASYCEPALILDTSRKSSKRITCTCVCHVHCTDHGMPDACGTRV